MIKKDSKPSPANMTLNPREYVRKHLLQRFQSIDLSVSNRLPTMRTLAKELKVSVQTVQAVYKDFAKDGLLRSEVGKGSFLVHKGSPKNRELRIALASTSGHLKGGSSWTQGLISGVMDGIFRSGKNIIIIPIETGHDSTASSRASRTLINSNFDGAILFPFPDLEAHVQRFEAIAKPVIFINTPLPNAVTNFVSVNYFKEGYDVGRAWRQSKRTSLAIISNTNPEKSISTRLRMAGLLVGFSPGVRNSKHTVQPVNVQTFITNYSEDITVGFDAMQKVFSASKVVPDCIYSMGGIFANGIMKYIHKEGIDCPGELSYFGGPSIDLQTISQIDVTRSFYPLPDIGASALKMLVQRIEKDNLSLSGRYFDAKYTGLATLTPEERSFLKIDNDY